MRERERGLNEKSAAVYTQATIKRERENGDASFENVQAQKWPKQTKELNIGSIFNSIFASKLLKITTFDAVDMLIYIAGNVFQYNQQFGNL